MNVGDRFESQEAVFKAIEQYSKATDQVFVTSSDSVRVRKNNDLSAIFKYSKLVMNCKHGGGYRAHRSGEKASVRSLTTTAKMECPVKLVFKLSFEQRVLIATTVPELGSHNHPVSRKLAVHYNENRKLDAKEITVVNELLDSGAPARMIASTINATRTAEKKVGLVTNKDVFNKAAKKKADKRGDNSEEQLLRILLDKRQKEDPEGTYRSSAVEESSELRIVFIQTGVMKETFSRNSEVVFIDSTYRYDNKNSFRPIP